jgi:hypothetical protein
MAGSYARPQRSWTGVGMIWPGEDPSISWVDALGIMLASAAANIAVYGTVALLLPTGSNVGLFHAVLQVALLVPWSALVVGIVWWRWRRALGVVLVMQTLVMLILIATTVSAWHTAVRQDHSALPAAVTLAS